MKYLQKTWIRVLVSLVAGGIIVEEITVVASSDPNHIHSPDRNILYTWVLGAIIFFVLTAYIRKKKRMQ